MTDEQPDAQWREHLRSKGYRLTPQRELVLAAVEELGHGTPDEVLTKVHERSKAVNISTVYRTLELLEELDLVRHTHLTDRAPTYHTRSHDHIHLVCRGCEKVLEAHLHEFVELGAALHAAHGFTADIGHLTIFGTCADCTTELPAPGDGDG